jgi:hypothetical protein
VSGYVSAGRTWAFALALAASAACAACDTTQVIPDPVPCSAGFLGDAGSPVDFEFLAVDPAYDAVTLDDGGALSILTPPQGGRVVFVGVRATNLDSCGVQLTGAVRDPTTQQVRFDMRTVNLIATGDGWGVTGPIGASVSGTVSNFANIPVCPNQWSTMDVDGNPYALEVTLTDRGGRTVEKKIQVTPGCGEPATLAECQCICGAGYVLGSVCPIADASADVDANVDASVLVDADADADVDASLPGVHE